MLPLRSIHYSISPSHKKNYPYHLPIFQQLQTIHFTKPITILVGDNGTGKSTLLKTLATAGEMITIGGNKQEPAWSHEVSETITLHWNLKSKKGFYFKANDYIQFIEHVKEMKRETREAIQDIQTSDIDPIAIMPHARTLYDLEQLYGKGLEFRSHGESFLDLFQSRFQANGLYILDEPEAPLSPLNQLALISLIKEKVDEKAQFILATHSPILMALPEAEILLLEDGKIASVLYDELEHVTLTRDFLNHPESFLRHL